MANVVRRDRIKLEGQVLERGIYVFEPSNESTPQGVGVIRRSDDGFSTTDSGGLVVHFDQRAIEEFISKGDVIFSDGKGNLRVALSSWANQNTLLLTDECDNRCSFCSQPPKPSGHYFENAILAIKAYEGSGVIGLTGGEPTLFWDEFLGFAERLAKQDQFSYHLLSHGRNFAEPKKVQALVDNGFAEKTLFGIPVHGPDADSHDRVTGQIDSFSQTVEGIQNLAYVGAALEIRIIVTQQILPHLVETVEMLWSLFRWAKPVIAVMQLEPVGWANKYYESLFVESGRLAVTFSALQELRYRTGCQLAFYNFPLCHIPETLRDATHQSISDWKNQFYDGCGRCVMKKDCSGFFASAKDSRRPSIYPVVDL